MNTPLPLIQKGWLRALLFILVFFAGAVSLGVLVGYLLGSTAMSFAVSVLAGTLLAIVVTTVFRRFIDRQTVMSLGFSWRTYQHHATVGGCLSIALLGVGTLILYAHQNLQWNSLQFKPADLFIAFVLMILVAIGEEIVFRGYILNNLMQSMNKWAAWGISSVLFALAHAGNTGMTALAVVNLVLGGLVLGLNYIYTRNLWYALLFHLGWNFFQGPVLGYDVSGVDLQSVLEPALTGPAWLTGGAFGFEGSAAATIVLVAALLVMIPIYQQRYSKP